MLLRDKEFGFESKEIKLNEAIANIQTVGMILITVFTVWMFGWFLGAILGLLIGPGHGAIVMEFVVQLSAIYLGVRLGAKIALWRRMINGVNIDKIISDSVKFVVIGSLPLLAILTLIGIGAESGWFVLIKGLQLYLKIIAFYFFMKWTFKGKDLADSLQ